MKKIDYQGKKIDIPQGLEELTQPQYVRYLDIALMLAGGNITPLQARLKLLTLLLELPVDVSLMPSDRWDGLIRLLPLTDAFVHDRDGAPRLDTRTGTNLLPQWQGVQGPGDMLNGISFGTFIRCSALLGGMAQEEDEDGRLSLMGQVAEALYPGVTDAPQLLRAHACLFFLNVLDILQTEPLDMDGTEVDFRCIFEPKKTAGRRRPEGANVGWAGVAMDIAELGAFGNYRQVLDTPMWDIFTFLVHKQRETT